MMLLPTAMTLLIALIFVFVSIGPELAKDIHSDINPLNYASNINNSLAILYGSCAELINVIHALNNSSAGYGEFPTFVAKLCEESFKQPLTFLINS